MTTGQQASVTVSDLAGRRIKETRLRRGWTAAQLAARCADLGAPELTASVIANVETGRRDQSGRRRRFVTVDELLTLAYALDVAPVLLFVPVGEDTRLQLAPNVAVDSFQALSWVSGEIPPPGEESAARRHAWLQTIGPVRFARDLRSALEAVDQAYFHANAAATGLSEDSKADSEARVADAMRNLAGLLNLMVENAQHVPSLPAAWVGRMRRDGMLRHPDDVPVQGGDDGSS